MTETVYNAEPELRDPSRFFAAARADLRHTGPVAWRLFRRNLQARYRKSWLGYVWLLLPIVATTLVWTYIHARRVIVIETPEIPYPVHVLAGMALWQTFVDAWNAPLQQFSAGRQLVTRTRVPLEALILSGLLESLLNCAVRLLVVLALLFVYDVRISASLLLVPAGVAAIVLLGLAFGVVLAPLGLLYEDVGRAFVVLTGLWFFLTPVIYPTPAEGLLRLNPVTPLLDTTRAWLTSSVPRAEGFVLVTVVALAMLSSGWVLLRVARPHVVERLG